MLKRLSGFITITLLVALLAGGAGAGTGLPEGPIAGFPTSGPDGMARVALDGNALDDCTSGGGEYRVLCVFDGVSTWSVVSPSTVFAPYGADFLVVTANAGLSSEVVIGKVDDTVIVANGTTWQAKTLPSCSDATTSKLLYDNSTNTFSCGTDQSSGGGTTFDAIGSGSNTAATMTCGAGCSLIPSSTGIITATAVRPAVTTVNFAASPYTALITDYVILCDSTGGAVSVTLPAATNKLILRFKNVGTNSCTISRAGADTIDGGTSATLTLQYQAVDLAADGTSAWSVF